MIKEVFASGETLALAKKKACELLSVDEAFVEFEVVQFPEKKHLGFFGGRIAQVKATLKSSPAKKAVEFLKEVFFYMGLEKLGIEITREQRDVCELRITGEDVKFVVGYHGETLDSLQYLTGFVANNPDKRNFCKIRLEAGNYRENRKKVLENLARKMAYKVLSLHQMLTLEPMRSYERKIIHEAVQAIPDVYSWSDGFDALRHVVISPTKKDYSEKVVNFEESVSNFEEALEPKIENDVISDVENSAFDEKIAEFKPNNEIEEKKINDFGENDNFNEKFKIVGNED